MFNQNLLASQDTMLYQHETSFRFMKWKSVPVQTKDANHYALLFVLQRPIEVLTILSSILHRFAELATLKFPKAPGKYLMRLLLFK
ncbi:hypothetical protein A0J61_03963 [Choanephora cucurbitarum]|uniref:Uncharacterized protein n=1 Tax=Choanephora cucurbitarum TaxID=101091 RepID=A0A1C7NFV4_9FUNG|nr:hypothetical protein A0J61_03963 [Choanephora cucurbitarum]